jgi:hypothetical protein
VSKVNLPSVLGSARIEGFSKQSLRVSNDLSCVSVSFRAAVTRPSAKSVQGCRDLCKYTHEATVEVAEAQNGSQLRLRRLGLRGAQRAGVLLGCLPGLITWPSEFTLYLEKWLLFRLKERPAR